MANKIPTSFQEDAAPGSFQADPAKGGGFLRSLVSAIDNNPVSRSLTSLSALPVQLGVKAVNAATGKHFADPYAGGMGGGGTFEPVHVTSSDQGAGAFAKEEVGNAITAGSLFFPAGEAAGAASAGVRGLIPKIAPKLATSVGRIIASTGAGYLTDVGTQMQSGSGNPFAPGMGTALGFGLSTAGELGGAILDHYSKATPTSRLQSQTNRLKTLQNSFDENSTYTKDPQTGKLTMKTNPISTLEETGATKKLTINDGRVNVNPAREHIQELIAGQNKRAMKLVEEIPGTLPLSDFKSAVIDGVKANPSIRDAGKINQALAEIERRFGSYETSFGKDAEVQYKVIDNIRAAMNKEWDPEVKDVARTIGDTARTYLYGSTGNPELKGILLKEGELIKAHDFLDRLHGTVVKGGRLGKYIADLGAGIVGGMVGSAVGGPIGAGVGGPMAGLAADKMIGAYQNSFFNPIGARVASKVKSLTPVLKPALRESGKIGAFIKRDSPLPDSFVAD